MQKEKKLVKVRVKISNLLYREIRCIGRIKLKDPTEAKLKEFVSEFCARALTNFINEEFAKHDGRRRKKKA